MTLRLPPNLGRGTGRAIPLAVTFRRARAAAAALGVTRLGDITGLDIIGIPVFQAVRPAARSISVSQGKGFTRMAARVAALMEAIEIACAEAVAPDHHGPGEPADLALARALGGPAHTNSWCTGRDLLSGAARRVPHNLVSMDYTVPGPRPRASSNGLASGNDLPEAIAAALAELLERDAHARWLCSARDVRQASAIDLGTVNDRRARHLLARVEAAGLGLRLWDLSAFHDVATLGCAIYELGPDAGVTLPPSFGTGAHPCASVALRRAVTEAAQIRATLIAGARDDITPSDYAAPALARLRLLIGTGADQPARRSWTAVPDRRPASPDESVALLLGRFSAAHVEQVVCVDLSSRGHPFGVAKLLAPGLMDPAQVLGA